MNATSLTSVHPSPRPPSAIPHTAVRDPDIGLLMELAVRVHGAKRATASLHVSESPPVILGSAGIDARRLDDLLGALDAQPRLERRRHGEREPSEVTIPDGDGELRLTAWPLPLHRDAVLVLALDAPDTEATRLLPWAEAYARLWWRRRSEARWRGGLSGALDLLDLGVVLIDAGGGIGFANRQAEALLAKADGVSRLGASLGAGSFEDAVRVQTAVASATRSNAARHAGATLLRLRRAKGRPLVAAVASIPLRPGHPDDPGAIVYLLDPDADIDQLLGPVCDSYGLTSAESRLVKLILSGRTLAQASANQRLRLDTAKSYLKQIFAKTGTHRQAELVRVMLSSVLRVGTGTSTPG